jgi:hypothetical protein
MAAISWNPSSFRFAIFLLLFSLGLLGLAWELHGEILWEGRMIGRKLDLVWTFLGMYRWFGVVSQGLFMFLPFFLFGDFWSFFLDYPWRGFESVSFRDSCWMSRMRTLCLFAWWPWSNKPSETALIWVFSVVSMGRCSWGLTFDSSWFSKFWWTKS